MHVDVHAHCYARTQQSVEIARARACLEERGTMVAGKIDRRHVPAITQQLMSTFAAPGPGALSRKHVVREVLQIDPIGPGFIIHARHFDAGCGGVASGEVQYRGL